MALYGNFVFSLYLELQDFPKSKKFTNLRFEDGRFHAEINPDRSVYIGLVDGEMIGWMGFYYSCDLSVDAIVCNKRAFFGDCEWVKYSPVDAGDLQTPFEKLGDHVYVARHTDYDDNRYNEYIYANNDKFLWITEQIDDEDANNSYIGVEYKQNIEADELEQVLQHRELKDLHISS